MSVGFDRMLYTDCAPGTGRGGGGGFQWQAQSPEIDSVLVRAAEKLLLYSTQVSYVNERRDVAAHPLGLAHMAGPGFGTAQSRYLGKEVSAGRQGNHLADCLVTAEASLYGAVRPAQLWEAPFWRPEPFETTECSPFTDDLELGPLDHDAVQTWLREHPARKAVLQRLLTVLDDEHGSVVRIVTTRPREAATWIAAATILMPQRTALQVSFKIFHNTTDQVGHRIIALPHELFPQVRPDRPGPFFVLDADEMTCDVRAVSNRAEYWVTKLMAAEEPFDVVDAVEIADRLTPTERFTDADARDVAWAIVAVGEPLSNVESLRHFLEGGVAGEVSEHGPAVVQRLLTGRPTPDALRLTDRLAAEGTLTTDRQALRRALLQAEIGEVQQGRSAAPEDLDRIGWDDAQRRDASSELTSAIALGSDHVSAQLFRLARRHGFSLAPPSPSVRTKLFSLVTGWVERPEQEIDPGNWALSELFLDHLTDQLRAQLQADDARATRAILPRIYQLLLRQGNEWDDPITWELEAFLLSRKSGAALTEQVQWLVNGTIGRGDVALQALASVQRSLVAGNRLNEQIAVEFAAQLPTSVELHPEVEHLAVVAVTRDTRAVALRDLRAVAQLGRRGVVAPRGGSDRIFKLSQDIETFTHEALHVRDPRAASRLKAGLRALASADPKLLVALTPMLADIATRAPLPQVGSLLLEQLPTRACHSLLDEWNKSLSGASCEDATVAGLRWAHDHHIDDVFRERIVRDLQVFGLSLEDARRQSWVESVRERLSESELSYLERLVLTHESPAARGRVRDKTLGFKGRFSR